MANRNHRSPYRGTSYRRLAIALDVGTTFSGISFAVLDPGEVPKIESVLRYPGQENIAGSSKIPTVMYYDRNGVVRSHGAEAEHPNTHERAEDEGWSRVEWFKLHLRPASMKLDKPITPLPRHVSAQKALADFLRYLAACAKRYIEEHRVDGANLWAQTESNIAWIISHPNGWQGLQQAQIREAAIQAGLIPPTEEGRSRVHFVTEGEASLHACIDSGVTADLVQTGNRFIIADAGGGTLDISSYVVTGVNPLRIEESTTPACVIAGSIFVTMRAKDLFIRKLGQSRFASDDSIKHIATCFDNTTKRIFNGGRDPCVVVFGSPLDRDLSVGVRNGQLKLTSDEVKELFEPSCKAALQSIEGQMRQIGRPVQAVFLVGGFASSTYLYDQLRDSLKNQTGVYRPDMLTSKAVAEGAVSYFLDHYVSARMAKQTYGSFGRPVFDPNNNAHRSRIRSVVTLPSGRRVIGSTRFYSILRKDTRVEATQEFSCGYFNEVTNSEDLSRIEMSIRCYKGGCAIVPEWEDEEPGAFKIVCQVEADISGLKHLVKWNSGPEGRRYCVYNFEVVVQFGLTEMAAFLRWEENGLTRRSPANIIYTEDDPLPG